MLVLALCLVLKCHSSLLCLFLVTEKLKYNRHSIQRSKYFHQKCHDHKIVRCVITLAERLLLKSYGMKRLFTPPI